MKFLGRLWRRMRGGHWEHWLLADGGGPVWIRMSWCSQKPGKPRPWNECRGTPTCEDYRKKKEEA